ncbi:MAG: DMT family transporter [Hyphomicrobiaceae bacterium]
MTDNLRGILAILASATGFVINDALVKLATQHLPSGQIIVLRGLMSTVMLAIAAAHLGSMRSPRVLLQPAMLIRLFASASATVCIVGALRHLPLPTTSAILQVTPLVVTAGAAILLGAHVGWRRWTASIVGFCGVLLILRPGGEGFVVEAWLAVLALFFTSTRDLTTRFIDHSVPSLFVAAATSGVITLVGATMLPFETWVPLTRHTFALLAGAAIAVNFAYYLGIVAMRTGEIPVVAPFRYALILLALLLGYLVWGHVPDQTSMLGMAVVTGAGLYLLHRERRSIRAGRTGSAAEKAT